jgi:broad specificity phosphatase PhoE
MRLILTRHGETEENKEKILQGHMQGVLSEEGKEQARKLGLRLKSESIDVIYSSDLARSADTAREIAKYHPAAPFHLTEELRERNLGPYTGMVWGSIDWTTPPNDFETNEKMYHRAKNFLDGIYSKHKDEAVLCVGHNGINKAIISVILGKPAATIDKNVETQHNTALSIFEIMEDKSHKVYLLNCNKHLE